ncbi:hypothetical protein V2J09_006116 [Rumex salicifolius]
MASLQQQMMGRNQGGEYNQVLEGKDGRREWMQKRILFINKTVEISTNIPTKEAAVEKQERQMRYRWNHFGLLCTQKKLISFISYQK